MPSMNLQINVKKRVKYTYLLRFYSESSGMDSDIVQFEIQKYNNVIALISMDHL